MNFNGKNVLVYGYGKSGKSAAKLLNKKGANVKVYDDDYSKKDYLILTKQNESGKILKYTDRSMIYDTKI